jgi:flagellar basal body-associated protein FliL
MSLQKSPQIASILRHCLTSEEEEQIHNQFHGQSWDYNNQVLWTGVPYKSVTLWAKLHHKQTLAHAMGPLMIPKDPLCLKSTKSLDEWSNYIKGASVIFAWHISARGDRVTVLSRPPPERFNPCGLTNYQCLELPILQGLCGNRAVLHIDLVHPTVRGAENFSYHVWPTDETRVWTGVFGAKHKNRAKWRAATQNQELVSIVKFASHHSNCWSLTWHQESSIQEKTGDQGPTSTNNRTRRSLALILFLLITVALVLLLLVIVLIGCWIIHRSAISIGSGEGDGVDVAETVAVAVEVTKPLFIIKPSSLIPEKSENLLYSAKFILVG